MPSLKSALLAFLLAAISFRSFGQVTFINAEKEKPASATIAQAPAPYSIGDPTDDEQMHLELINRARADANAEAIRLIELSFINKDVREQFEVWNVDTNLMKQQFATNPPAGPLSFNAKLIAAARAHSQFQFDTADQTHTGSGGSEVRDRITAAGYAWSSIGENVFTNATSAEQGHAAFNVDWGPGPGGMQTALGHRRSIHNPAFVEVGIGIIKGFNVANGRGVGPQVITEDFARPSTPTTFVTGVAYYDINGNNFYDIGEGLPGVRVTVDSPQMSQPFAITSTSGGYSIPVPSNASYTVRFNVSGAAEVTATATVTTNNAKVDFKPVYTAPNVISGPATLYSAVTASYTISSLAGATGYRARLTQLATIPLEGAEGPLTNVNITTTGGYNGISTSVKASGTSSFHLAHVPGDGSLAQFVEFNKPIYVQPNARIDFKTQMAIASFEEFAALEVSEDDGQTWTTIWTQAGIDQPGESSFSPKTASLANYAGKLIRVRFVFDVQPNGSYYGVPPSDPNFGFVGWYLDDVTFVNAKASISIAESSISATTNVNVTPGAPGEYLLQFQAIAAQRNFPYGPVREVNVSSAPPVFNVQFTAINATTVDLLIVPSSSGSDFAIESAPSVTGPWSRENVQVVSLPGSGNYAATVPRTGDIRFYRAVTP